MITREDYEKHLPVFERDYQADTVSLRGTEWPPRFLVSDMLLRGDMVPEIIERKFRTITITTSNAGIAVYRITRRFPYSYGVDLVLVCCLSGLCDPERSRGSV